MSLIEEKILLLQYLEGSYVTFVEGFGEASSARGCIREFLSYVRPFQAIIMQKLMYLKQNPKESLAAFIIRFNSGVGRARVNKKRLK